MQTYDHKVHGVSQSILTTYMSCKQKSELKLAGWRATRLGKAMVFGIMAHDVIGEAFSQLDAPPALSWVQRSLREAMAKVKSENPRMSVESLEEMNHSAAVLVGILPIYFQHYKSEFDKANWVMVESNFRVNIPGVPFPMVGRYDRVRRVKGKLWLYETKTKSRVEDDYLTEMLHFDIQDGVYLQAILAETKEMPVGVVYDVLRNPGLKQKVAETDDAFQKRIIDDVVARPEFYFIRYEVVIDKSDMQSFQLELARIANEFDAWREGEIATWKNTMACKTSWGMCEMIPICARNDYSNFNQRTEMFPELKETKK
ncbi:MAG: PD-(D/E)XK nuclease family protein [Patescibacteria group bacterium]